MSYTKDYRNVVNTHKPYSECVRVFVYVVCTL